MNKEQMKRIEQLEAELAALKGDMQKDVVEHKYSAMIPKRLVEESAYYIKTSLQDW
jgi:hypothetical protein